MKASYSLQKKYIDAHTFVYYCCYMYRQICHFMTTTGHNNVIQFQSHCKSNQVISEWATTTMEHTNPNLILESVITREKTFPNVGSISSLCVMHFKHTLSDLPTVDIVHWLTISYWQSSVQWPNTVERNVDAGITQHILYLHTRTFTVVTVGSVWASWCSFAMVHGVGWRVGGSLKGTVVCVMLIKHITDVTKETWRGKPLCQLFIIVITIATQ